jgi:hypothetical protein
MPIVEKRRMKPTKILIMATKPYSSGSNKRDNIIVARNSIPTVA